MRHIVDLNPRAPRVIRPEISSYAINHSRGEYTRIRPTRLGCAQSDGPRLRYAGRGGESGTVVGRVVQALVGGDPDISSGVRVCDNLGGIGGGAQASGGSLEGYTIVG